MKEQTKVMHVKEMKFVTVEGKLVTDYHFSGDLFKNISPFFLSPEVSAAQICVYHAVS